MRKTTTIIAAIILLLNLPLQSGAWGLLGHRIVGEVADHHLTAKTRKEIRKILGGETIAMASNWMDFIKSDPSLRYLGEWHYVNLPKGQNYEQARQLLMSDTAANAYTKVSFITSELKKKDLPLEMKQFYIRALVHIVGDIHQPMHCGRAEDKGGNDIKIKWFGRPNNLHSLWDSELIDYQQLSYTEYANAIDHADKQQIAQWQNQDLTTWIFESYKISESLYEEAERDSNFSYKYNFDHYATLNQQLLKGGVRLAALLNQLFG